MIVDCISDLHGNYPKLDGGDLLIVAGDLTKTDSGHEYLEFREWIRLQGYKKKIFIAGNHDDKLKTGNFYFNSAWMGAEYLCDSGTEFEGFKIWGSPWSLWFKGINPHCKAFTGTEKELAKYYHKIPEDTDILITHAPPMTVFDMTVEKRQVGSCALMSNLINRVKPKLHVFGHIHESYGQEKYWNRTLFVNASHVNERYEPVNKPIRVVL